MRSDIDEYHQAIMLLEENNVRVLTKFPASSELIADLEQRLGVTLPKSYVQMLKDFGIMVFKGHMIYGLGKTGLEGDAAPNVVFATKDRRQNDEITASMVEIMPSGYGPFFVIDCDDIGASSEATVWQVSELGVVKGKSKVAESFGEFLLAEVKDLVGIS